jgi:hypothetical protein
MLARLGFESPAAEIRQALADGRLKAWGVRLHHGPEGAAVAHEPWLEIGRAFWANKAIYLDYCYSDHGAITGNSRGGPSAPDDPDYQRLMVSRAELRREWPDINIK